jgi:hypothetical protein
MLTVRRGLVDPEEGGFGQITTLIQPGGPPSVTTGGSIHVVDQPSTSVLLSTYRPRYRRTPDTLMVLPAGRKGQSYPRRCEASLVPDTLTVFKGSVGRTIEASGD